MNNIFIPQHIFLDPPLTELLLNKTRDLHRIRDFKEILNRDILSFD